MVPINAKNSLQLKKHTHWKSSGKHNKIRIMGALVQFGWYNEISEAK